MPEEEPEVPICRIEKGRIRILPQDSPLIRLPKSESEDLIQVLKECSENLQPAWYFGGVKMRRPRRISFTLVSQGLTLREEMILGYKEQYEENLELAKEFECTEADLIDPEDQ
jgi:hypothetical protein